MARDITQLHPRLQANIAELKKMCAAKGLQLGIGECLRSVAEQDALYAQGRTTGGNIVTNAKGSSYQSQHQWGIAFDFFKNIKGQEYNDSAFFAEVAKLAKSLGLAWGGDWTGFVDKPHLYLPDWGSDTTKLKSTYGTFDNFKATWNNVETDTYTVVSGDTLSKVETKTGVAWEIIANLNGIKSPYTITIGQVLKLKGSYVYNNVDYSLVFDATYYVSKYADLRKALGMDAKKLFNHFVTYGMKEGRQAISTFNVHKYKNSYADLQKAFGDNLPAYYKHYIQYGKKEKRKAV